MDIRAADKSEGTNSPRRYAAGFVALFTLLCLAALSCDEGTDTEKVSPESFTINATVSPAIATVGIVEWSLDVGPVDFASIAFGPTEEYGMIAPVSIDEPNLRTLLLGMKPSSDYHFEISAISGNTLYRSGDNIITTGPVVNGLAQPSITLTFPEYRAGGFMVFGTYNPVLGDKCVAVIVDADGDYVWWFPADIVNITRARMTYDGKYMVMIPVNNNGEEGAIQLVSMDGLWSEVLDVPTATHDLTPLPDNRIAFLSVDKQGQEVEPCGKIEALSLDGSRETVFDTSTLWEPPCHLNAVRYSSTEDVITLSDLIHSQIIGVSMAGEHLWTANQGGGLWNKQHGHQLLDDSLLVFSNWHAEALEFAFEDPFDGTLLWSYVSSYSSMHLGDVQRLPNGNTLVTYTNDGVIQEVSDSGEPVQTFAWGMQAPGYVSWRASLYGPPDDIFQ